MSDWIEVIILGIVQGLSEFLPISSTGHLLVFSALLGFQHSMNGTFEIFIQIGTLVAVIGFFRRPLWFQATHVHTDKTVRRLWTNIIVGSIPVGILGAMFRGLITEKIFPPDTAPSIIALTLILGGIVFLWVESRSGLGADENEVEDLSTVTMRQACLIGLVQALALIPGTSRSGASIVGGLLVGLNRRTATAFSFYLAIPALGGATTVQMLSTVDKLNWDEFSFLVGGAVIAGVVGWVAISWLLQFISTHDFRLFGYYRIGAGLILILLLALEIL